MANLAALLRRRRECDSRGQLILITAFALAAIFLGLAIIVNSAIFTENLATRGENVEGSEALEYRYEVTQFAGGVIEFANEHNRSSHEEIRENVEIGVADIQSYTGVQQVQQGAALSLALSETNNGSRIFQGDASEFTNNVGESDWTLASGVENTRAFEVDVTEIRGPVTIVANDTGTPDQEWTLEISSDEVTVTRQSGEEERCTVDEVESVDITGTTVNGNSCPALEDTEAGDPMQFAAGIDGAYAIEFENGHDIDGSYSLVVEDGSDGEVAGIDDDNYGDVDEPGETPYTTPAMYSATVELDYETQRVEYETTIVVAPGELR